MSVDNTVIDGAAPGNSAASVTPQAETQETTQSTQSAASDTKSQSAGIPQAQPDMQGTTPGAGATTQPTYTPNFKYKAALQEKELDAFWRPLVKDPESEKKVKELFSKVDAFDFVKTRKEQAEQQVQSMTGDLQNISQTVQRFNESVNKSDLTSAFRLANISKEQVFKWTQQQLQLMDMPPEQRQQYEQFEQANAQKYDLEQKVTYLQQQYETQATQARVVQLDVALSRPEVSRFAEAWDQNSGSQGAFKSFVIEEAKKVFYESKQDLNADQAIGHVMQRFGKFLNVGEATVPPPQAVSQHTGQRPVIPNVTGKAASPIKKVPKNLDDLKRLAKEANAL